MKSAGLLLGSLVLWFALAEGVFQLLPVKSGLQVQPVDADNPVMRFQPDREFVYSHGPWLTNVNRGRVNNEGFVNDQDYDPNEDRPLLAVIGDSYIEAEMVPFALTLQGRLMAQQQSERAVYSFASSGSSLLEYLFYADYARRRFHADWLVINVVGNDFDEMLLRYKQAPGFHYLAERGGSLEPVLIEYRPSLMRQVLRHSALARYVALNLGTSSPVLIALIDRIYRAQLWLWGGIASAKAAEPTFVGNTAATTEPLRLELSQRATAWVLDHLAEKTGLPASHIVILMDGYRVYDPALAAGQRGSFFGVMREYLIAEARRRGYEVQDLQEWFERRHRRDGAVVDFPDDAHWAAVGHEEAANAVTASATYARFVQTSLQSGSNRSR